MKQCIRALLLLTFLLFIAESRGKEPERPCFTCFAEDFAEAIRSQDVERVKRVSGSGDLSRDLERFLFDSSFFGEFGSDGASVLEFVSAQDLVIVIEAANIDGSWEANIFFVKGRAIQHRGLPVISQLGSLKLMKDYVVCPVVVVKGRVALKGSLCLAETD